MPTLHARVRRTILLGMVDALDLPKASQEAILALAVRDASEANLETMDTTVSAVVQVVLADQFPALAGHARAIYDALAPVLMPLILGASPVPNPTVAEMAKALERAAGWFDSYANQHHDRQASVDREMAAYCRKAATQHA